MRTAVVEDPVVALVVGERQPTFPHSDRLDPPVRQFVQIGDLVPCRFFVGAIGHIWNIRQVVSHGDMNELNSKEHDVLVIGGGPAGENAADLAARGGLKVALIEHELLGGECTYWACMPSKGLLRPGDALDAARRTPGAGAAVQGEIDVQAALERRDALASNWDDAGQVEWLEGVGVELIRGHGRLAGPRIVEVAADGDTTAYHAAKAVIIATGTSGVVPSIEGIDTVDYWTSRDVTTADDVPERLTVIGAGPVGVEMAQAWNWLGSEVTLLELAERLLPKEEPFVGEELRASLERAGIVVHTGAETQTISQSDDVVIHTRVVLADGTVEGIDSDRLLVAVGRQPNTGEIGLDSIGLEPGEFIEVDNDLLATGVDGDWLYAVGDVNGRSLLTHTGKYQARIAGAHIAGQDTEAWGDLKANPRVVFTSPEIAAVGLTEAQARERGVDVAVASHDIGGVAGSSVLGKGYRGTCQIVVDRAADTIVGATFVGPRVSEILHSATIAIIGEVPIDKLWHATPSFPTLSEVWLRLLEAYRDEHGHEFN